MLADEPGNGEGLVLGYLTGVVASIEQPPAGVIWRLTLDSGKRIYLHEADVAAMEARFQGLPKHALAFVTGPLDRVVWWGAFQDAGSMPTPAAWTGLPEAVQESLTTVLFTSGIAMAFGDGTFEESEVLAFNQALGMRAAATGSDIVRGAAISTLRDANRLVKVAGRRAGGLTLMLDEARGLLDELPNADRLRFGWAVLALASAVGEAGSPGSKSDQHVERVTAGIAERLGVDLEEMATWVKTHGA